MPVGPVAVAAGESALLLQALWAVAIVDQRGILLRMHELPHPRTGLAVWLTRRFLSFEVALLAGIATAVAISFALSKFFAFRSRSWNRALGEAARFLKRRLGDEFEAKPAIMKRQVELQNAALAPLRSLIKEDAQSSAALKISRNL